MTTDADAEDDHHGTPLVRAMVGRLVELGIIDADPEEYTVVREDTMRYDFTVQESDEVANKQGSKEMLQNAIREAVKAANNQDSPEDSSDDDSGGRLSYDEMCERMQKEE